MDYEFVDLATKAKELGVSEAVLRSRVLSDKLRCFVFVNNQSARGDQDLFLPAWSPDSHPLCRWDDHGSRWNSDGKYYALIDAGGHYLEGKPMNHSHPVYSVSGWVGLDLFVASEVLTKKRAIDLHGHWIWVYGDLSENLEPVPLRVRGWQERVVAGDDAYNEIRAQTIELADICFPSPIRASDTETALDPRREKSLLRVIRALDVMNKLPERGAAGSVVLQLEKLGFPGPDEDTVRKIIKEARSLEKP